MTTTARRPTPYHKGLPVDVPTPAWMDRAACLGHEPEAWFPPDGHAPEARAVCAGCPVRADCLAHALATDTRDGIWGGVDMERERPRRRR